MDSKLFMLVLPAYKVTLTQSQLKKPMKESQLIHMLKQNLMMNI